MKFLEFPSISAFHNKVKNGRKMLIGEKVYNIKPKLHGTNASIVYHPEHGVYAQSRKRVLSLDFDNFDFAKFVSELDTSLNNKEEIIVIYGEWAGTGVQKTDAISKIGKKIFAPFAVFKYDITGKNVLNVYTSDEDVKSYVKQAGLDKYEDVVVIDTVDTIKIDFNNGGEQLQQVADFLNSKIEIYNKVDTWVKEKFGVEDCGEGFVVSPNTNDFQEYNDWTFKIKTDAHAVNKNSKPVIVNTESSKEAFELVERFVTEARMEQGVHELGGEEEMSMRKLGDFLKWVNKDVLKESVDELEASELEWRIVSKVLNNKAKMWFIEKYK